MSIICNYPLKNSQGFKDGKSSTWTERGTKNSEIKPLEQSRSWTITSKHFFLASWKKKTHNISNIVLANDIVDSIFEVLDLGAALIQMSIQRARGLAWAIFELLILLLKTIEGIQKSTTKRAMKGALK